MAEQLKRSFRKRNRELEASAQWKNIRREIAIPTI